MKVLDLSVGAYGPEVTLLQEQLQGQGYDISSSEVARSFFGPSTRAALMRWQQHHELPATGALDDATSAGLAVAASRRESVSLSTPALSANPPTVYIGERQPVRRASTEGSDQASPPSATSEPTDTSTANSQTAGTATILEPVHTTSPGSAEPRTVKDPVAGGNGGPGSPRPVFNVRIKSPTNNAQLVGPKAGATVTVGGTYTSEYTYPGTEITVSGFGGTPQTLGVRTGSGPWSCTVTTGVGGPITILADMSGNAPDPWDGQDATASVSLAVNSTQPILSIQSPIDYQETPGNDQGIAVTFKGTLSDPAGFGFGNNPVFGFVSPVTWIGDWSVPGVPAAGQLGPSNTPDNWATWSVAIQIPPGLHTLNFTCTDIAGNQSLVTWHVKVVLPSDIFTTTEQDYLKALLRFATQEANKDNSSRILVGNPGRNANAAGTNLTYSDLIETFYQHFPDLTLDTNLGKATEDANQIRLVAEVLRRYTTDPTDPVAYWKCGEGSGATTADSSGNGLTGTLVNASWALAPAGQSARNALQFSGNDAYVQLGNPPQLKMTAAVTIAAWVYPTGPGSDPAFGGVIVSKEAEYEVARDAQGNIIWAFANTQPAWNWINTKCVIPLNQWAHIAVTYDNGLVNTYFNGQLVHSYSGAGPIGSADPNNHDFRIGGRQAGLVQFFQGFIDEVKVFNRALNAHEVDFTAGQISIKPGFAASEAQYRQTAYLTLLNQVGTSYDEIRLARAASQSGRQALAEQLGIDLSGTRPDHLDALFQDALSITEQKIEQVFGLADTTRNPLSDGAKISDVSRSVVQWNLDGVKPGRNTDPDGFVYVTLQAQSQTAKVYSDAARTLLVGQGMPPQPSANILQFVLVPLSPVGNSGLSGSLVINFSIDANDIKIAVAPSLHTWQMGHIRSLWATEDFPQSPALISVTPNTAQPGQNNLDVAITGQFTHFIQGMTLANFGAGVSVVSLTVNSPTSATAVLNIDPAAASGPRNLSLTTNLEVVTLTNGLIVTATGAPTLIQMNPGSVSAGQMNVGVAITGQSTNFVQGTTTASFGTGIAVLSLIINSPTSATALLNIDPVAALGTHDVTLTTNTEVAGLPGGLFVTATTRPQSPIIDPDLLIDGDFVNANTSDNAYALYVVRKSIVQNWVQTLQGLRASGLDAVFGSVLKDSNHLNGYAAKDILLLDQSRRLGNDISPYLTTLNLSLDAFNYLVKICGIYAATSQLLDSEWSEVFSILVQTQKVAEFAAWRGTENSSLYNLTLSPDWFDVNNEVVQLPAWRATAAGRLAWQAVLQGRINQQESLDQELKAAVDATEQQCLPSLRDALVETISVPNNSIAEDWLTERFLMNVGTTGNQKSTRLDQAVDTLENLFFTLRNGGFQNIPDLSTWSLNRDASLFDTEWKWMGTYSSWQAVTNIFLYPQNSLLPYLRESSDLSPGTMAFQDMLTELINSAPLSPEQARTIASHYLKNLQITEPPTPALPAELGGITINPAGNPVALSDQLQDSQLVTRQNQLRAWWQKYDALTNAAQRQAYLNYSAEIFYFVPLQLALQLQQAGQFTAALDWYHTIYAYRLPELPEPQRRIWYGLVAEEGIATTYDQSPTWLVDDSLNPHDLVVFGAKAGQSGRALAYTRFTLLSLVQCFLAFADSEFSTNSQESIASATNLYLTALSLLSSPQFAKVPGEENVPQNQLFTCLRQHAGLNLQKIRAGYNISGILEEAVAGPAARTTSLQPTQYSYQTLIDRAKQLVGLAQQVESSFLAALEKTDAELYNDLKAQQDLKVANQNVTLQGLMVTEAKASVNLAQDQQGRAQIQVNHYSDLINSDISGLEQASVDLMSVQAGLQVASAAFYTAAAIASGVSPEGIFSFGSMSASSTAQAFSSLAQAAGSTASALSAQANFEEKQKDWQFQLDMGNQDVLIAGQQIQIANDHVDVVTQQQTIATTQATNAQNTLDFLTKQKFTNAVLYQWMTRVLQGVYSYFLQQATTIARLAQSQLAFERQEPLLNVIQADYWQPPSAGNTTGGTGTTPSDTKGLTGAELLLQGIYELDQYAFATNQRKLQITKTISLAELDPFAFQQFTETGVLQFATPAGLFDADFPGHYLRLIQQVRTSVIALIPPTLGIRATLSNTGVSRVTVENGGVFSDVLVRRDPQEIAFSSPLNATGVLQLDPQQGLLLPFQGLGVATSWEFQMPKSANPFDYSTIVDVLVMIDYTAFDSADYRQQVTQGLSRSFGADRGYSFKQQFADAWYELNNPSQSSTPMVVQFTTEAEDFPPNVSSLQIQQLLLHFVQADGASFQISVKDLQFTPTTSQTTVDVGSTGSTSGTISTRRGNAANWVQLIGQSPRGQWQLALPDDNPKDPNAPRNLIANGQITDILFVITYNGNLPAWPS